jgi:hypothetical protein
MMRRASLSRLADWAWREQAYFQDSRKGSRVGSAALLGCCSAWVGSSSFASAGGRRSRRSSHNQSVIRMPEGVLDAIASEGNPELTELRTEMLGEFAPAARLFDLGWPRQCRSRQTFVRAHRDLTNDKLTRIVADRPGALESRTPGVTRRWRREVVCIGATRRLRSCRRTRP